MSAIPNQTNINNNRYYFLLANASTITANNIFANQISTQKLTAGLVDANTISTIQFYADLVNIDEATISSISTNAIELDGAYLTTANGTELLLNGVPLATTQNLSSIADWAYDPAVSTVTALNAFIDIGTSNLPFRYGYFSTITARNAIIQSTTLTLTETVSSLFVNDLFASSIVTQDASISTLFAQAATISSLQGTVANFSTGIFQTLSTQQIQASTINANTGFFSSLTVENINISPSTFSTLATASDWYLYPAKGGVSFQKDLLTQAPLYDMSGVRDITCRNLTAVFQAPPMPIGGGKVEGFLLKGVAGDIGSLTAGDGTFDTVDIDGSSLPPFFDALTVDGGVTFDGGNTHGFTFGTNTFGVSLNRIDILPVGTQDYVTWGAMAHIAGLGMTLDAGLGINIAAGLVVDVLGQDVQLRANDAVILDADDNISMDTGGPITMNSGSVGINTGAIQASANNMIFSDSNFAVISSNANSFNAQAVTQGTPLPPSTLGFYSTFLQNSQIANTPQGALLTAQSIYGLYQNISTIGWVVQSNISTSFSTFSTSILSSYTSTITSSFQTGYSTLSFLQSFPTGEIAIRPSSLLLQHADKIELDTKPFPIFTTLTPGLSTIVSSLYTYEAILDGSKYSEIGEIIQTIVPVVETLSSFFVSTGVSSGTVLSTLTSSFFSTLVSQASFTSSIYNQILYDSNCFSTPAVCVSTINSQQLPYAYGAFSGNTTQTVTGSGIATPVKFDTTEIASYVTLANISSVQVQKGGVYRIIAGPEFATPTGGQRLVDIWLTKNGQGVDRTNSQMTVANNGQVFTSVEFLASAVANDQFGLAFQSTDGNMALTAYPGVGSVPSTPGILFSLTQITS